MSCSQFEHGYFTAYARIVEDDPANYAGVISEQDAEPDQDPAVFRERRTTAYRA